MKNIIVITGASSGFGALVARALAKAGHTVYASMRDTAGHNAARVDEAKRFSSENNVDLRTIELDVLSEESVNAAIQKIVAENGRLDVVIHNAGHMVFGPAEAFMPEQLAELYDINVRAHTLGHRNFHRGPGCVYWRNEPLRKFRPAGGQRARRRIRGRSLQGICRERDDRLCLHCAT